LDKDRAAPAAPAHYAFAMKPALTTPEPKTSAELRQEMLLYRKGDAPSTRR